MSVSARITNVIGDGSGGPSVGGGRSTDQEAEALEGEKEDAGKVRGAFLQVLYSTMTYHAVEIRALALVDVFG